ncbi:hypothetical protein ACLBKU_12085 [Erythrobacter sp. NE805]|uniref:hypothetical protein n=1 Tax=Erythrobacter sp. NE805 TaxID=3389875 RepID=UPI00396B16D6
MMSAPDPEGRWELSLVEKIVGTVLIGLLGWMAFTLQGVTVDVAVIKNEIASGNRDRFSAQEGQRLADRIQRAEDRIKQLEERTIP